MLLEVTYGNPQALQHTYLRDWYWDKGWLKGIACNEHGVADRDGCAQAELWIAEGRIQRLEEVEGT